MTIEQAYELLGVTKQQNEKEIKRKFRKLMAMHHPDVIGSNSPEQIKQAQRLNEAYALIKKAARKKPEIQIKRPTWKAKVTETAFCERTVYMESVSWEGETPQMYAVARGRYEWEPELEEFPCFLRSVKEAALELLERAEYRKGITWELRGVAKGTKFDYHLQLFHLLAGQFISPVACLDVLARLEEMDDKGRMIYKILAWVQQTDRVRLQPGELLSVTGLKHNRIMVATSTGTPLGHVSFLEDSLYYVVVPILQHRKAQIKLVVREVEKRKKTTVEVYLRMEETVEEIRHTDYNLRIAELVSRYEKWLEQEIKSMQ